MKNLKKELTEEQFKDLFYCGFFSININNIDIEYSLEIDYEINKIKYINKCFLDKSNKVILEKYTINGELM